MLKSRTEESEVVNNRTFYSHDSSAAFVYLPHLIITYMKGDETSMDNIGIENGTQYYIKNKASNRYLTALGTSNNSNVTLTDWTGNDNQKWTVQYQNNGYYKLIPANATNMVLDTSGGNNADGVEIQLYSPNTGL